MTTKEENQQLKNKINTMKTYLEQIDEKNSSEANKFFAENMNEAMDMSMNKVKIPNKLRPEIISELNDRLTDEYHSYFFYINAANWCKDKNYDKAATFFEGEAENELSHAKKMRDYLVGWNTKPTIKQVQTDYQYRDLLQVIEEAYDMEYGLLQKYNTTSGKVMGLGDFATFGFLGFYRDVQIDEVKEYSDYLNTLQLIDINNKLGVLRFEKEYFG